MLNIISKFRLLLVFWLSLGLLSTIASIYFSTPLLEGTAAIEIGRVGIHPIVQLEKLGNEFVYKYHSPIEEQSELMANLAARYRTREAKKQLIETPYLVEIDDLSNFVIILTVYGTSIEEIEHFLNEIMEWVLNRHNRTYDQSIQQLEKQRDNIEGKITDLMNRISQLPERNNIDIEISPEHILLQIHSDWRESLQNIEFSRLSLLNYRSHIVQEPIVREKRLKPKPVLYFVTALFCSLVAFVVNVSLLIVLNVEVTPFNKRSEENKNF